MLVFVLNHHGKPLMPCKPSRAKKLLKAGRAKVVRRAPFTINLLFGSSGYKQSIIAGIDSGSKIIGSAVIANGQVLYQAEIQTRQDVSKKMQQRAMYRRNRRGRKTRYRKARWQNRASMRKGCRIAPSIKSKLDSHLREKRQVEKILPVTEWHVETASFDIHKITNPDVSGIEYQNGSQKGFYNIKAYILHRDRYKCKSGRKANHSKVLHVHHIQHRSNGGTDTKDNLITLCSNCHDALHRSKFELKAKRSKTKHATEIGVIKAQIKRHFGKFVETFGYETKYKREKVLKLPKTHYADAVAICCNDGETVITSNTVYHKRHVAKGDYQQTKGARSEKAHTWIFCFYEYFWKSTF
jgi:5-methylcytosine-specific restriction endonuclease McrA